LWIPVSAWVLAPTPRTQVLVQALLQALALALVPALALLLLLLVLLVSLQRRTQRHGSAGWTGRLARPSALPAPALQAARRGC
jgi:hypothetical protein